MKGIADTGFLVAFVSENDFHHDWATTIAQRWSEPFLTCESVLSETAFHLGTCSSVFDMLNKSFVTLAFDCKDHLQQLDTLARQYADQKPDFADLCLIRMTELFPKHPVITIDREDFRVYRRNKREAIPLICPPE
jgi:predicted nucleic acid-binding protein